MVTAPTLDQEPRILSKIPSNDLISLRKVWFGDRRLAGRNDCRAHPLDCVFFAQQSVENRPKAL